METLFPFGFPWPTALYLSIFIVTMAVYTFFMNYVLAGTMLVMAAYLMPGARRRIRTEPGSAGTTRSGLGLIVQLIRDWLPAVLTLTIVTGIIPLLFLQVLYQHSFYTANLLLLGRFLLIVPVIIVVYFMLYLIKGRVLAGNRMRLRVPVMLIALGCVAYITWTWTEGHILSLHPEVWKNHYASHLYLFRNAEIWPRLGYWITASFATLALAVAWQLHWGRRFHDPINRDRAAGRLRSLAILGLGTSAAESWLWVLWLEPAQRAPVLGALALPYAMASLLGMAIQLAGWIPIKAAAKMSTMRFSVISIGALITMVGTLVAREARRLAAIDIIALFPMHRQAAQLGGLTVFLGFLVVNTAVIVACILLVRRALRSLH